jgi:D-3-phosphoglycerate dehydrogenase
VAHKFFLFTENVLRENILPKADHVTPSFDEFLFVNQMPRALSFPKNRIRALLLNGVPEKAREVLEQEGYQVEILTGDRLETDFARYADKASILGVRAGVKVDRALLRHANRLMALAVFGAGTQAIDLEACTQRGIIVFNAPYTHTRSQVELAIGQMIMLLRRLAPHNRDMHAGRWRLAAESGFELRGKKLGIIGYGNSGQQLSVLAEALGMDVYYYDLVEKPALGNATKCERLKDLLRKADIVSLHVDNRPENKDFFGAKLFKHLREHAIFVNVSNGDAVDLAALAARLRAGQLRGAAIDVFPGEPDETDAAFHTPLSGLNNVVLTPHVGGATAEARQNSAIYVPSRVIDYVNTGNTFGAVNFPELQLPTLKNAHRLIHIHENQPGVLAQINQVLAEHRINILGQYLKTNDRIGYVITDIDKRYGEKVLEALKKVEGTIKFRVLY